MGLVGGGLKTDGSRTEALTVSNLIRMWGGSWQAQGNLGTGARNFVNVIRAVFPPQAPSRALTQVSQPLSPFQMVPRTWG